MLVFTPIYNFAIYMPITGSHVPFSHAFFGAYRHALTVGFIMMMIVGVSSKVVPTLSGVDVRARQHAVADVSAIESWQPDAGLQSDCNRLLRLSIFGDGLSPDLSRSSD